MKNIEESIFLFVYVRILYVYKSNHSFKMIDIENI